ncbi:peptidoglycan-binding protein [Streptomyces sp. NPDC059788]|uniref:peptidoglycan-binding domain-containing protein n=1 Tax=Streptomyces sp. NPDC059788 TaxID=3346948 RepID=UPI00366240E4
MRAIRVLVPIAAAASLALGGAATVATAAEAPATTTTAAASPRSEHGCSPHRQSTISRGSSGAAVKHAQCLLKWWGFSPGAIDGVFGTRTENAVRNFQRAAGLSVDGIVGPNTWAVLHY